MLAEVAAGVIVEAAVGTARWLRRESASADGAEQELIRWFDTYRLSPAADAGPRLPEGLPPEPVAEFFRSDDSQSLLHELLASRLTDAPEAVVRRLREAYVSCAVAALAPLCATAGVPEPGAVAGDLAAEFFDHCDVQIATLVGRLAGSDGALLDRVRQEAFSARVTAVLGAIERHTRALSLRDSASLAADQAFVTAYRRQAAFAHGSLEPPDFERRRRVPIEALHVSPGIRRLDDDRDTLDEGPALGVTDLEDALDRTVLLGDPGCGKSTTCQVLVHRRATDPTAPVPFLVVLREFAVGEGERRSVVEHIEHRLDSHYQCPAPPGAVERLLLSGAATVVFDGLDELVDTSRRREVTEVVELFCTRFPLARVLVTSRIVGYHEARLDDRYFECYRLGSFGAAQTEEYVEKWFAQEEGTPDEARRNARGFLAESSGLTDLRANPLMLSLMCILYRGTGFIPRSRPEVYEQCATLLFHKWDVRRRIQVDLAMSRLVEPALRDLALWLFTRDTDAFAVTERELVARVVEFLDGRGYEERADAEAAAHQFVGFCRGRAWVFTEVGTTARGDRMYTFTHRTFLEYFAAAQLAALSDTPEDLARRLAPRVAAQEWDIVGQLAVQIKERTAVDGAARVFVALLDEIQDASTVVRGNVLAFLARCLSCVEPPPRLVRRLTRATVDQLLRGDPATEEFSGSVAALIRNCGSHRNLVADELSAAIADAVASEERRRRHTGLLLAGYASWALNENPPPEHGQFWWAFVHRTVGEHTTSFRAADGIPLLDVCVGHGMTTMGDHLHNGDVEFASLFHEWRVGIFGPDQRWSPYATRCLFVLLGNDANSRPPWETTPRDCSAFGAWVREHAEPPWAEDPDDVSRFLDAIIKTLETGDPEPLASDVLDSDGYLGAAVLLLTSLEASTEPPDPERLTRVLGPLAELGAYARVRRTGDPADDLPDLPVPAAFRDLLRAWARREVDFVRRS